MKRKHWRFRITRHSSANPDARRVFALLFATPCTILFVNCHTFNNEVPIATNYRSWNRDTTVAYLQN